MTMVGIQKLIDVIALSLQSTYIKNEENGVSLLLIAKPETAKTTSIFQFSNLDFVGYYDEITQKKLIDDFLPDVKTNTKKTLLIPDLINCIDKQKSTREQFLSMLKSGTDDTGIVRISTYHKQLQYKHILEEEITGLKFNVITAITVESYKKTQRYIKNIGLLSRFVPFSYDYPLNMVSDVFKYIEGSKKLSTVNVPKIRKKEMIVPNNPNLFKEFEIVSTKLGIQYGGYGIRMQKNLQRLSKANAILNKRTTVIREDIDKVMELSNWINFDFNMLR